MNIIPAIDLNGDGDTVDPGEEEQSVASMDIASYAGAMAGVTVDLASGKGTAGDAMGDTLVNIEQVMGSSNDDTFIAGSGADNIVGGDHGDDDPMTGMDKEDGDTVSYELSDEAVQVTLGILTVPHKQMRKTDPDSYATGDTLAGIENIIWV